MNVKKALITGITGQDGYYLTCLLLQKGYAVHGIARRNGRQALGALEELSSQDRERLTIHWGDVTDASFIEQVIRKGVFNEIYHLAAQSFVPQSFTNSYSTYQVNITGTLHVLNAIRDASPETRMYHAATSEMYGLAQQMPQTEQTPFYPRSPYGISKLAAFWMVKSYRESYGLFATNGILFNHESELRNPEFVTQKIAAAVALIVRGKQDVLELGNLDAKRDWGYAPEYVEGAWRMLQQSKADDYVLATGEHHTIREFVERAFAHVDLPIRWEGEGLEEVGVTKKTAQIVVRINPVFYRPAEVPDLLGDSTKARTELGWVPKTSFDEIVRKMIVYHTSPSKEDILTSC